MACGTDKTLTSLFIREKLAAERTLVLLPSLSLLKQTMQGLEDPTPRCRLRRCPSAPTRR